MARTLRSAALVAQQVARSLARSRRIGRNYGQVYVELGHTKVMVVVTSEAVVPRPERPTEGFFQFFTEVSSWHASSLSPARDTCN